MTKADQPRLTAWPLQEAGASARNVARTCRPFGLSRRTFYKWRKRYKDHGAADHTEPGECTCRSGSTT